jgi:hypothetical protein
MGFWECIVFGVALRITQSNNHGTGRPTEEIAGNIYHEGMDIVAGEERQEIWEYISRSVFGAAGRNRPIITHHHTNVADLTNTGGASTFWPCVHYHIYPIYRALLPSLAFNI